VSAQDALAPLDASEEREVRRLVELLDDPLTEWRVDAQMRLLDFGRRVIPMLRTMDIESAEARMRVHAILQVYAQLELTAELQTQRYALGAPVIVSLVLTNHTRETYLLPLGQGEETTFLITIGDQTRALRREAVAYVGPNTPRGFVTLGPGESLRARGAIRPEDLPRRAAGTYKLSVRYRSNQSLKVERAEGREDGAIQGDPAPLSIPSNELSIDISTRTPAEIEIALQDAKHRTRALVELQLREDEAVLPLLRRHVDDPDLRLHAIRTLGAKGDEQDLGLIRRATGDPDRQVRVAATIALGNFPYAKACMKLATLATTDHELRLHAVQALTKHKSARTIQAYVAILDEDGPWVPVIQKALKEWTGKIVRNEPSEIAAFERWWRANRADWIKRNG
jgi:hypothetical protein